MTKKIIVNQFWNKWAGILLLFCLFNACAGSKKVNFKNPKSVSLTFYKALATNDYERAKEMGTTETKAVISLLQNLNDLLTEEEQEKAREANMGNLKLLKKTICTIKEAASGDTAECQICCDETGATSSRVVYLKKENDKWLIHITKESLE